MLNPLLAGFVQHSDPVDPTGLSADLDAFCDAIPELANKPDLRAGLRISLAARYGLGVENVGPQPEPEIIIEQGGPFDDMTPEKKADLRERLRPIVVDMIDPGETDNEGNPGLGQDRGPDRDHGDGPETGGPRVDARDPQESDQH